MPSAPLPFPVVALGGPRPRRCQIIQKEYPTVLGPLYSDGGQDSFVASSTPSKVVWEIEYEGMPGHEAAMLDEHNDSALDVHLAFDFTDPETGVTWLGVKYLEFQRGARTSRRINKRLVKLIWRP